MPGGSDRQCVRFYACIGGSLFFSGLFQKKEGIKISVRSERPTLDAGKIISKALKGIGSGGGHATMAGGFVPFDGNDREEDLMIQNIRERFIDVISRTKRKSLR